MKFKQFLPLVLASFLGTFSTFTIAQNSAVGFPVTTKATLNPQTIAQNNPNVISIPNTSAVTQTATPNLPTIAAPTGNSIVITNPGQQDILNYPLQFARPFIAAEISQFPQLVQDGTHIPTQAVVKQRYPDGSVRHAIISAVLPKIPAHSSIRLFFVNQMDGHNTKKLTKDEMLNSRFNFDATMKATFSNTQARLISARAMLQQNKFSYWSEGDIATTVLVVDHSVERQFDFGADNYRSVRPAFYLTFWPTLNQVQVRFVGEVTNTIALQDQTYDLQLSLGLNNPQVVYQKTQLLHQAMTRWTKQFWMGTQPPIVSINHNLSYLAKTNLFPNFDTNWVIPEASITEEYAKWKNKPHDLYEAGFWQRAMASAGGRPDIGLYPSWTVRWLYSGDWRLAEMALTHSELTGAWPMHLREGDSSRTFDEKRQIPGLGHILSIHQGARPTGWIPRLTWPEMSPKDVINPVGDLTKTIWVADVAHHPDYASAQYLLTGDYYFLDQSLFSAAFTTMNSNGGAKTAPWGRGPTGSEGGLYAGEIRAQAWGLRTRVHTASIVPDAMPEKQYFTNLTLSALSMWEGIYDIRQTSNYNSALWNFGRSVIAPKLFVDTAGKPSPLGMWRPGHRHDANFVSDFYDMTKTASGTAPWEVNLIIIALGRAEELGYPTGPMKQFVGRVLSGPAQDSSFPLELLSAYRQPVTKQPNSQWFTSWKEVQDAYLPNFRQSTISRYQGDFYLDSQFGYNFIVWAAASYITDLPQGNVVWKYYNDQLKTRSAINRNPKWAVIPRQK